MEKYKSTWNKINCMSKALKVLKIIGGILSGVVIVPVALVFALTIGIIIVLIVIIVKLFRLITFANLREKRKKQIK